MKNRIVVLSVAALALSACTESVTAPYADPGDALLASNGPAAIFDLTTPTLSGGASGSSVTLDWTPTNLQAVCDAAATANTLNDATTCWGVHWEVYRNGVKIAEPTASNYTDSNVAVGAYDYMVKAKGMEGTPGPSVYTHHSRDSNVLHLSVSGGPLSLCAAPTSTLVLSTLVIMPGGGNTETVTVSGQTTNVIGCPGGTLQYKLLDSRAGESSPPGGDHSVDWTNVTPASNGSFSFDKILRSNNVGRTYTFWVRVKNDANPSWVQYGPVVVTVVAPGGGSQPQSGRVR